MSPNKLITLVTGANQGLGYYAAQQLAATGAHHVLLGSRDHAKGQKAADALVADASVPVHADDVEALHIDVDDDASIEQAVKTVEDKFGRLDVLVNNAGISTAPTANPSLRAEYRAIYNTNLFGTAITTQLFTPLLRLSTLPGGKRIIFVSSSLSSLTLATTPGSPFANNAYPVYRSSKSALNMLMAGTAAELRDAGFVVGAVCPGYCGTNLNGFQGFKDPREGARAIVDAVRGEREEVEGRVVHRDGEGGGRGVHPW